MIDNKKDINDFIIDITNHVKGLLDSSLSEKREFYSLVSRHFGEENTDFIENKITPEKFIYNIMYINESCVNMIDRKESSAYIRLNKLYFSVYNYSNDEIINIYKIVDNIIDEKQLGANVLLKDGLVTDYNMLPADEAVELYKKDIDTLFLSGGLQQVFLNFSINETNNSIATILIHFDKNTITNENGDKHTIYDSYFILRLLPHNIVDTIQFIRGSLSFPEILNRYYHSHTYTAVIGKPATCCFGTSDLKETSLRLRTDNSLGDDETYLKLFFMQLELFLEIESLAGGPYVNLIRLNTFKKVFDENSIMQLSPLLQNFLCYLTKNAKELNFVSNLNEFKKTYITCGLSWSEKVRVITNLYIDFCKENNLSKEEYEKYLFRGIIYNDYISLYGKQSDANPHILQIITKNDNMFTFKGKPVSLQLVKEYLDPKVYKFIFNPSLVSTLIAILTTYINLNYE